MKVIAIAAVVFCALAQVSEASPYRDRTGVPSCLSTHFHQSTDSSDERKYLHSQGAGYRNSTC